MAPKPLKTKRQKSLRRALKSAGVSTRTRFFSRRNFLRFSALATVGFIVLCFYFFWGLPNPTRLTRIPFPASTKLLDRHGRLIYEIFADQRRTPIKLDTLPDYVVKATLAAEDKDFYRHSGFSVRGIARAFLNTFFRGRLQGGSTITQQLVKKALLTDDRTIKRKVREFALSAVVEVLYSKDQILEMYLNQVPYGGTAYGLESAAQTYFGKSAPDLTLAEAALLAGLPQAPSFYSPFGSRPEQAINRQKYVLSEMLADAFISQEDYDQASAQTIVYTPKTTILAPHFSLWVKDLLIQKYGLIEVEEGGLIVTTTLDLDLQEMAQAAVATETAKLAREHVGNGAALITHPRTGGILAMVGSKDYFNLEEDGNVNVTLALRQPGSAIKPINYGLAIDRRLLTAATLLNDKPTCFTQANQKDYCPDNYDNQFHGPTQVRFALGNSFNIPAVKALSLNGLSDFVASASAFGLTTFTDPTRYGPSLTLGGGEVTMLDLSTAYGVFANSGKRVDLNPIISVIDRTGKSLESIPLKELSDSDSATTPAYERITISSKNFLPGLVSDTRVVSPATAFLISHILYDNGARSATFGSSSYLNIKNHPEVSVKTGTTNDKRDNWTIGYNPDILVAVWVGNNDNTPMSRVASGVTGASPIWNKIMTAALKDSKQRWPTQPADAVGTTVCSLSGLRVPENPDPSCSPRYEYFLAGTQPGYDTGNRRDIPIYKPSSAPASSAQISAEPGNIEMQSHLVLFDALGTQLCIDCPGGYGGADLIRLNSSGKIEKR